MRRPGRAQGRHDCTDSLMRDRLLNLIEALAVQIHPITPEINRIAKLFIDENCIPEKYQEDALHLAFALFIGADYIVSWNFKHIVKPKTKIAVKIVALHEGFREVQIVTPEELIADDGEI